MVTIRDFFPQQRCTSLPAAAGIVYLLLFPLRLTLLAKLLHTVAAHHISDTKP